MQPVTPIVNGDAIICTCGNTMAQHRCPSSIGYAPRAPKIALCTFCGLKQHQNLDGSTVRLECLYRQWAQASGQLQIKSGKSVRYAVPPPTNRNVAAFGAWIASGQTDSIIAIDETIAATMDAQEPTTASNAKRAEERAAQAPAMPNQVQPTYDPVETATAVLNDLAGDGGATTDVEPFGTIEDMAADIGEPTEADLVNVGTAPEYDF
jgi:hypothetical protein